MEFPIALEDKDGLVVLFYDWRKGTVIKPASGYPIGYYTDSWYMNEEGCTWKEFKGTCLLTFG